jgi:hypothetical protein
MPRRQAHQEAAARRRLSALHEGANEQLRAGRAGVPRLYGAGKGVFATRDVADGERLCTVGGIDVTALEGSGGGRGCTPHSAYVVAAPLWRDGDPGRVPLPGQEVHAGIGHFANRAAGGGALRRRGRPPRVLPPEPRIHATLCNSAADVCLRATRRIRAGEEVYIGYGATYTVRAPPAQGKRKQRGTSAEHDAAAVRRRRTAVEWSVHTAGRALTQPPRLKFPRVLYATRQLLGRRSPNQLHRRSG